MSGPAKWGWENQWTAQRGRCWICLDPMQLGMGGPLAASVEHIVPKSRGGGERWNNKLLAHRSCNSARGAPFIWVPLTKFRKAAMLRLQKGLRLQSTVEGVDLRCSDPSPGARKRSARELAGNSPLQDGQQALRVTLAELSSCLL